MDCKGMSVKINQKEMESLFNLKSILNHKEAASSYGDKYQELGWVLQAVDPQDGTDLEVDSGENPQAWVDRLWEPGLSASTINLGVATGKRSRLMVLEVTKGRGESILDQYGPWRAECIAALGARREQHFYAWAPSPLFDSAAFLDTPEIRWFGEGQVVLAPPSLDPEVGETWEWLCPPWEKPPQSPSQSLSNFLQQHLRPELQIRPEVSLSWQEIYCLVSPHEPLLRALSASCPSVQNYYQGILGAAAEVGVEAPEVLLALLWHAPRGNARQHPEIWGSVQELVAKPPYQPGLAPSPGKVPWELFLDNALALAGATSGGSSGQAADKPGQPGFFPRRLAKTPHPGAAMRTPFSCCRTRGDWRESNER
jgi:hypothetical protein